MATWGGLNPALTAWRNGINRRLPGRDTRTDGARADKAHGSTSQHQEDADGTVDAFDQDINVLKSSVPTGTAQEDRIIEAMKRDFEQDPHERGQLWIEDRQIANKDVGDWRVRAYTGDSPHTEHIHWQSDQDREDIGAEWPMPHLDALLRELRGEEDMTPAERATLVREVRDAVLFDKVIPDFSQPETDPATGAERRKLSLATWVGYSDHRRNAILTALAGELDEGDLAERLSARMGDAVTAEELLVALRGLFTPTAPDE
jgi:hypothetical protein